jgi:AcrR family transcriptional regulator
MIGSMSDPGQAEAPPPRPGGEPAPGRAAWGTISRAEVVAAAAEVVTAGGYEEMSIRSLAASLGVAPMSLYRHIRDKDDLLSEVTDRLLAGAWRPAAAEDDWQPWITEAACRLRDFLVSQPAALHVYLKHPVVSPAAIERMNAMMGVLRRAGLSEEEARSAYGALHTYTIGFAALEASRAGSAPSSGDAGSIGRQLAAYTTTGQFIKGLRYLLQGIRGVQAVTAQEVAAGIVEPAQEGDAAGLEPGEGLSRR